MVQYKKGRLYGNEKFPKVIALHRKKEINRYFPWNQPIVISEKLDGANARVYRDGFQLVLSSRRTQVGIIRSATDYEGDFRGFVPYIAKRFGLFMNSMKDGEVIFGEWLVKHTVVYPEEMYNQFYVFPDGLGTFPTVAHIGKVQTVPIIPTPKLGIASYDELVNLMNSVFDSYNPGRNWEGIVLAANNDAEGMPPFRVKKVKEEIQEKLSGAPKQQKPNMVGAEILGDGLRRTIEKRFYDVLMVMELSGPEAISKQNIGQVIGRLQHAVWEDVVREFLVDNIVKLGGRRWRALNLAEIRGVVNSNVQDYLRELELI